MVHKGKKFYLKKQQPLNDVDSQYNGKEKSTKRAKIIVRNLPFKNLSEKTLEDVFKEFGEIEEIKILKKDDGKFVGCGFVQFKKVLSAAKAIHHANQKEVNGRKIIVDWALPKNTFLNKIQKLQAELNPNQIKSEEVSDDDYNDAPKFEFSMSTKPGKWRSMDKPVSKTKDVNYGKKVKSEDDDDDDDDDDDYDYDKDGDAYENEGDDEGEGETEDGDEDEDILDDSGDEFKKGPGNGITNKKHSNQFFRRNLCNDVEEGKTVFVRNVPFSVTNDDLRECFEAYGPLEYALICTDKLTEHSKGTAFVKFKEKDNASQCIKDSKKIYLHENPLTLTTAVSKENLENKKASKKIVKDSRNLYLLREGVVMAGSKAAVGVSASDMAKRLQIEQWKTQILKNLNMFVSKTRLVVHNLPPTFDDSQLKQLFLKHCNPKAIIKEAKVMKDKKKFDGKGNNISKEVGFVSFVNHEDALTALRNINNNPKIFTVKRRPIVAFSIENKAVLNTKQKRIEKSRAKLGIVMNEKTDKLSKLNRKQRRFIRRREKIIEKRREAKKLKKEIPTSETKAEAKTETNIGNKRKRKGTEIQESHKKIKKNNINSADKEIQSSEFAGVMAEPGKQIKLRSRFKLRTQADIHKLNLKKEKRRRKENQKKRLKPMKQPKQKKGKRKLLDDAKLSKLISKHRESVQESAVLKKWYDK